MAFSGVPLETNNLNNLKDILQTYNKITDICFNKCVTNMNYKDLTEREAVCVQRCSSKYISGNQRIMGTFMEVQSHKQQKMIEEAMKQEQNATNMTDVSTEQQAAMAFDLMKQNKNSSQLDQTQINTSETVIESKPEEKAL